MNQSYWNGYGVNFVSREAPSRGSRDSANAGNCVPECWPNTMCPPDHCNPAKKCNPDKGVMTAQHDSNPCYPDYCPPYSEE